jgi:hypothetical protein
VLSKSHFMTWALVGTLMIQSQLATGEQQAPIEGWAKELERGEDFRIRTQAALALGASGRPESVAFLCRGLADTKQAVRAAAAAALGKLRQGGRSCLEQHLKVESSTTVKAIALRSLAQIQSGEDNELPAETPAVIDASTRFYVVIQTASEASDSPRLQQLKKLTRRALSSALAARKGFVVAPEMENATDSTKRIGGKKAIRGLMLAPVVRQPAYKGESLVVQMEVAVFRFPDRALKATIPVKLTQTNVSERGVQVEDELVRAAAGRVVEKLLSSADRLR